MQFSLNFTYPASRPRFPASWLRFPASWPRFPASWLRFPASWPRFAASCISQSVLFLFLQVSDFFSVLIDSEHFLSAETIQFQVIETT